jgi:homoserine O-acetyltransferase
MSAITLSPAAKLCHLPSPFRLRFGGSLDAAVLAYEATGPADAPAIVVLGGISAGRHLHAHPADPSRGWWEGFAGDGAPLDSRCFAMLSIDWLGGAGASTGPGSDPELELPLLATDDQADALAALLDELRIERLHAIVGASFGAMVALAFAARHPGRAARIVAIAGAERSDPASTALRVVQRRILALAAQAGRAQEGLALARALALTTYRTAEEFAARFAAPPRIEARDAKFAVEEYLSARGDAFARAFAPEPLRLLTLALDLHEVDPTAITDPVTLIGFRQDRLVPIRQIRALHDRLGARAERIELDSGYGHDGFLKEHATLGPILRRRLAEAAR